MRFSGFVASAPSGHRATPSSTPPRPSGTLMARARKRAATLVSESRLGLSRLLLAAVAVASLGGTSTLAAQADGGTIRGLVTDAATGKPVAQARVLIAGTTNGTLTSDDGRYAIVGVSAGTVTLNINRIGYDPKTVTVTVTGTEPVVANVIITQSPFSLSGVVVTATGQQRKVEIANATATINVADKISELPAANLSQVLTGRAAGVSVTSTGETGAGSRVRIRGQSSISLSNEPVVIIDGVRVSSSSGSASIGVGGQSPSRLDDINPEDIESIEVIKGPSAATLYGTEAAAGVINITTKRGRAGKTNWSVYSENGITQDPRKGEYPLLYYSWGRRTSNNATLRCELPAIAAGTCVQDSLTSGNALNTPGVSPISTGNRQQYGVQASGGTDRVQFFVSAEAERETGVYEMPKAEQQRLQTERGVSSLPSDQIRPQGLDRNNLRVNLNAQLTSTASLQISSGFVNSRTLRVQNNDNSLGVMVGAMGGQWLPDRVDSRGVPLPGLFSSPFGDIFSLTTTQDLTRFTNSATARWDVTEWLATRATVGYDYSVRDDQGGNLFDQGPYQFPRRNGTLNAFRTTIGQTTVDLGATATKRLTDWLGTKTSVGMQYIKNDFLQTSASGENLPPGATTITAAAIRNSAQSFDYSRTLGFYVEEVVSLRDRMYFTFGLRRDAASAFGSEARGVLYPKVGASWLISDEDFLPKADWLNTLRLRATYGASGQLPGTTDALRFFTPFPATLSGGVDGPSVSLAALGNSNLKPEFGAEFETGFDASLFNSRTNLEVTYYLKETRDALVRRDIAPSLSGIQSRFENIGNVRNSGFEFVISQQLVDNDNFAADITLTGSTNRNELTTLGEGVSPILTGAGSRITMRQTPGFPLYGMWGRTYTYDDANGDGILVQSEMTFSDSAQYIGPSFPTQEYIVAPTVELLNRKLRVSAQFDRKAGMYKFNNTLRHQCQGGASCRGRMDVNAPLALQAAAIAATPNGIFTGFFEDGSFTRFRELSVSYQLPDSWARAVRASRWNIVATGRNLAVWTGFTGLDPETTQSNSDNRGNEEFFATPPMRVFTARMNFSF
jgi:TonB-linked SusC/RagA family outer membrane protein